MKTKKKLKAQFDAYVAKKKAELHKYVHNTARRVWNETQDNNQAIFAQQFTTTALAELYRFKYRETPWANGELIDCDRSIDPGALAVTYMQLGEIGEAAVVADGAQDYPEVGLQGDQESNIAKNIGCSLSWTDQEALTASFQKIFSIAEEKSAAAKKVYSRHLDFLIRFGDPAYKWAGMTNIPNSLTVVGTAGWVAGTATAAQVLADHVRLWNASYNTTDTVEEIDTIVYPSTVKAFLTTTQFSAASDKTIMEYLQAAFKDIKNWEFDAGLNTADNAGTGPAVLGYRKERMQQKVLLPSDLTPKPVQIRGTRNSIILSARYAGIATMHPRSIVKMTGIA